MASLIGIFGIWCKRESWRLIDVSGKKILPAIAPESRNWDLMFERFVKHLFQISVFIQRKPQYPLSNMTPLFYSKSTLYSLESFTQLTSLLNRSTVSKNETRLNPISVCLRNQITVYISIYIIQSITSNKKCLNFAVFRANQISYKTFNILFRYVRFTNHLICDKTMVTCFYIV
jgi:hypothetical protein